MDVAATHNARVIATLVNELHFGKEGGRRGRRGRSGFFCKLFCFGQISEMTHPTGSPVTPAGPPALEVAIFEIKWERNATT